MRVLGLLRRSVNQARIRCRVLWLELSDRFKIGRVGHDFRKLLQLLQLIQFCFSLLLLNNSSAHDNSFFWLNSKGTPEQKIDNDKLETFAQLGTRRFAARGRMSKRLTPSSRRGHARRRFTCPPRTNRGADEIVP